MTIIYKSGNAKPLGC